MTCVTKKDWVKKEDRANKFAGPAKTEFLQDKDKKALEEKKNVELKKAETEKNKASPSVQEKAVSPQPVETKAAGAKEVKLKKPRKKVTAEKS